MSDANTLLRDGVRIPVPVGDERLAFEEWAKRNRVNDPLHPDHHYDNVGAFRAGIERDPVSQHFPDTYKLPGHESFSNESKYATGDNAKYAGRWEGEQFVAPQEQYQPADAHFNQLIRTLLNAIAGSKIHDR